MTEVGLVFIFGALLLIHLTLKDILKELRRHR